MDKLKALLVGLFILLAAYLTINLLTINAFGEQFIYNMSHSEIQDEWITQACIKLQIHSDSCDAVYGGILNSVSDGKLN
jgi:hypothetical protein